MLQGLNRVLRITIVSVHYTHISCFWDADDDDIQQVGITIVHVTLGLVYRRYADRFYRVWFVKIKKTPAVCNVLKYIHRIFVSKRWKIKLLRSYKFYRFVYHEFQFHYVYHCFFFLHSRENKTNYTLSSERRYVGVFGGKANQDRINRRPRTGS